MLTIRTCAAILAAGMTCALASAANVEATFITVNPGSDGSFSLDSGANWGATGPAGLFNWTRTGGDYAGLQGDFLAFCTELTEHVGYGNGYTYTVGTIEEAPTVFGGMGPAKADQLRELFGRYYTPAFSYILGGTQAAAMQMCVWEISHEQTNILDISGGTAQFVNNDGAAMVLANAMLGTIDGTGPRDNSIFALLADGVQDMIVPSPATIALAGAGLVTLARRRR